MVPSYFKKLRAPSTSKKVINGLYACFHYRAEIFACLSTSINAEEVLMGTMKVMVGPVIFDVKIIPNLVDEDGTKLNAQISYDHALITVEENLNPQVQALAVMHEAVHAILTQAGYDDHDEKLVELLAYGITGLIQDNPVEKWVRWD
jgi:hypothetical protein